MRKTADGMAGYGSGVREDAAEVADGRSRDVRGTCPDCGSTIGLRNKGEDGRCRTCTDLPMVKTAARPRTPEMLRGWAKALRGVLTLHREQSGGDDWAKGGIAQCEAQAAAWEREADELEGTR